MSSTIHKFPLGPDCTIELPKGSLVLSARGQDGKVCIWVLLDPEAPRIKRRFKVFGTGHKVPDDLNLIFIGTALLDGGALVFHVFEQYEGVDDGHKG